MCSHRPPRVLVFIVAYHAETTILKVLERITVEKENSLSREIDDLRDR